MVFLHLSQVTSVSGTLLLQYGHGVRSSSSFSMSFVLGGFLTIASIFLMYFASTCPRYSGRISIAAKLKAAFFKPALWHSITVEVNIGTISEKRICYSRALYYKSFALIATWNGFCCTNVREISICCWTPL